MVQLRGGAFCRSSTIKGSLLRGLLRKLLDKSVAVMMTEKSADQVNNEQPWFKLQIDSRGSELLDPKERDGL